MAYRVLINGASGKMGQEVVKAVEREQDLIIVGKLSHEDNLASALTDTNPDIVIDFTRADCAYDNLKTIIEHGAHPVIGTTGFKPEEIKELQELSKKKALGGIIAPNFSIGAILLMRYAKELVHYFPHVEIIELHHNGKADAPSGTAIKTAEFINSGGEVRTESKIKENILLEGARGAVKNDIHIHSVRLPGLVAHEEVIFGDVGQTLTLRHDTYHREAFMPGIILSCRKVLELDHLVYGLENIL